MHDDSNVLRHNSLLLSKNMLTKQLHCLVQSHGATNKEKIFKKKTGNYIKPLKILHYNLKKFIIFFINIMN